MKTRTYSLYVLEFPNGKRYFGISYKPQSRFREHLREAEVASYLPVHCAIRKYGADQVIFTVLVVGTVDYIKELEIRAIAHFSSLKNQNGYNVCLGGDLGPAPDEDVRARMAAGISAALKGKPQSSQHIARRAASRVANGKKWSAEARRSAGESQRTRVRTQGELERIASYRYERTSETNKRSEQGARIRWAMARCGKIPETHSAYKFGPGSSAGFLF